MTNWRYYYYILVAGGVRGLLFFRRRRQCGAGASADRQPYQLSDRCRTVPRAIAIRPPRPGGPPSIAWSWAKGRGPKGRARDTKGRHRSTNVSPSRVPALRGPTADYLTEHNCATTTFFFLFFFLTTDETALCSRGGNPSVLGSCSVDVDVGPCPVIAITKIMTIVFQ